MGLGLSNQPESHLMKNYNRYPVEFDRGEGQYMFDKSGKKYLDFLSGIAVTCLGHNNERVKKSVEKQLNKFWHTSNLFESSLQESVAGKLVQKSGLSSVFFSNSGTEANEAAIKFARKWGEGRTQIITAINGFHGRTMGSLSATGQYKTWEGFHPLLPGFSYVPFGDMEPIEYSYNPHLLAIMVEPIQGESGVIIPPEGYLKKLREFCDQHDLLLIFDEVQSGMGRTGKFFAHQWESVSPDIVTLAKGIANGIPLGVTICNKKVTDSITTGCHGSTFGGNPLAVAAADSVLDIIDEKMLSHITQMGEKLKDSILALKNPKIKTVRGKGLMIGVELRSGISAKKAASALIDNGILVGTSADTVLRLLPPFIINENDIDYFVHMLQKTMEDL